MGAYSAQPTPAIVIFLGSCSHVGEKARSKNWLASGSKAQMPPSQERHFRKNFPRWNDVPVGSLGRFSPQRRFFPSLSKPYVASVDTKNH